MSSIPSSGVYGAPSINTTQVGPGSRIINAGLVVGVQRLPTDPVGTLSLTLTNLINGSSIQIETQDGSTTLHNSTVTGTSKTITLSVYAPGNSRNDLRIKVRKGSAAPFYQPWETLATAVAGASSIYVAQISDQ